MSWIRILKLLFISSLCVGLSETAAFAASKAGVAFPDTALVSGKDLVLNGIGLRKATIFKVKVYAAALYLESKESDPEKILSSDAPKLLIMHFVRDVSRSKLAKGWKEAFKKNAKDYDSLKERLDKFNTFMSDIKEGQEIKITFYPESAAVEFNGVLRGAIQGRDFVSGLLSVWLGKPPNRDLKEGLLGKD